MIETYYENNVLSVTIRPIFRILIQRSAQNVVMLSGCSYRNK